LVLVTAVPDTDNGGNGSGGGAGVNPYSAQSINTQATVQPAQGIYISSYHFNDRMEYFGYFAPPNWTWTNEVDYEILDWRDGQGGVETGFYYVDSQMWTPLSYSTIWPATSWPQAMGSGVETESVYGQLYTNVVDLPLRIEHCDINQTIDRYGSRERRTADTELKLATGGPLGSTQKNLWVISAGATNTLTGEPIPYDNICIGNFGNLDPNGDLYVVLSDNDPADVTPHCGGQGSVSAAVGTVRTPVISICVSDYPTNKARTTVGVGEVVGLSFDPTPRTNGTWRAQEGHVLLASGKTNSYTARTGAGPDVVTVTFPGQKEPVRIPFTVLAPTGMVYAVITMTNNIYNPDAPVFLPGQAGAEMRLRVVMGPTNVSFSHVEMHEVPLDASNLIGFFTNTSLFTMNPAHYFYHSTARNNWFTLAADNSWVDTCWIGTDWLPQPWSSGTFTWNVPWDWEMAEGSRFDHSMTNGWQQVFSLSPNGTVRITKFDKNWVQRTTNNEITVTNAP
jgi:hypothetical protein